METIYYDGQYVEVQSISRIDGSDKKADGLHVWADELLRDAAGNYYAVRERYVRSSWNDDATISPSTETLRRISVRAAILWAVSLTGHDGLALRLDARAVLAAGRPQVDSLTLLDDADKEKRACPSFDRHRGVYTLPLRLSKTQWGMLRQAARYDGINPQGWVMDQLRGSVVCNLTDCYNHDEKRANAGWNGDPRPQLKPRKPRTEVPPLREEVRVRLEKRAQIEGTDLLTQYNRMAAHGMNAMPCFPKSVDVELDAFHGDLLRTFERRNGIDADTYARAIVEWHLEEMYDIAWNGGETEPSVAESIREDGRHNGPLTHEDVVKLCRGAGLHPADYPDAVAKEDGEEPDFDLGGPAVSPVPTGRRHTSQPEDIALLAAAAPEPVEDNEPLVEEEHVEEPRVDEDPAHIRAALLGVAAHWRAQAHEARTGALDLVPFSASGKLAGQADLLEMCADQLVATLDGKEGQ